MVDSPAMTGRADIIFALPFRARSAMVLPGLSGWEAALTSLGVRRLDESEAQRDNPDLVIAAGRTPPPGTNAPGAVLEGWGAGRRLRASGYVWRRLVALPNVEDPEVLLPVRMPTQVRYALGRSPPGPAWKRLRNRLIVPLLAAAVPPFGLTPSAVGSREPGLPFLVAAAIEALELPGGLEWLLFPGQGDPLTRATFHLFAVGETEPEWVLKFARVTGYADSLDRDERGLALANAAGEPVKGHAPRLVGRFECEGLHASVETAALGRSLVSYLISSAEPRSAKLKLIEEIAKWVVDASVATAAPPERLEPERLRLREEVIPAWADAGASASLVDDLPPLAGVLQHNDVGTWNIVVRPGSAGASRFTVLDWESALPLGMPLWDLWCFLYPALAELDGLSGIGEPELRDRERHAVELFRGELPSSEVLFRWTRRGVEACGVPPDAVGPLATLSFLHHGLEQSLREEAVREYAHGASALETLPPRLARRWLSDPGLGPRWDRWRS
jgi:phosphotransferase family enzyme